MGLNVIQLNFNSSGALPLLVLWVFAMSLLYHMLTEVWHSSERAVVNCFPLQDGFTALMLASQEGHKRVVETLLKGGARVDVQREVPLHWAVHNSSHFEN